VEILSPQELWQDYDREIEPDETVIKQSEDGLVRQVYFDGLPLKDGSRVRVYAKLILPDRRSEVKRGNEEWRAESGVEGSGTVENNNLDMTLTPHFTLHTPHFPVIIYAGGTNEDIDQTDVSYLTDGGYAVLLVDYAGDTGRKARYTLYPTGIDAYWLDGKKQPPREIKSNCWYYWTTCILAAATYLEKSELINRDKIGFLGTNEGAHLAFKASVASPIKCGVTFFGGCIADGDGEQTLEFKAALDSRSYAATAYPILINAAANSRLSSFDYLRELYDSAPKAAFCVCPDSEGAASLYQRGNVLPWFDAVLAEKYVKTPRKELSVFGSGGAVYAEVNTKTDKVEIYCAEDGPAFCRHFKNLAVERAGENKYLARPDIFDPTRPLLFFANLIYGKFTFSTAVVVRQPVKLGVAGGGVKSRLLFQSEGESGESENSGFLLPDGGFFEERRLLSVTGPLGLSGICGDELITFKPGDSKFRAIEGSLLQLTVSANVAQEIEICMIDKTGGERFCVKRIPAGQWVTFSLCAEDFKSLFGAADFSQIVGIKIKGKRIILNSMLWV